VAVVKLGGRRNSSAAWTTGRRRDSMSHSRSAGLCGAPRDGGGARGGLEMVIDGEAPRRKAVVEEGARPGAAADGSGSKAGVLIGQVLAVILIGSDGDEETWTVVVDSGSVMTETEAERERWSVRGGKEERVRFSSRSTHGMRTAEPRGVAAGRRRPAGMRGRWHGHDEETLCERALGTVGF
jgi:hypothetical protein